MMFYADFPHFPFDSYFHTIPHFPNKSCVTLSECCPSPVQEVFLREIFCGAIVKIPEKHNMA